jgi:alpha-glucoside transport system substrate-binding protein
MKAQRWFLALFLVLTLTLTACGGDTATSTAVPVAPTAAAAATNTTAPAAAPTDTAAPAAGAPTATTAAAGAATNTPAAAAATDTPAAPAAVEPTATLIKTADVGPNGLTVLSLWGGSEQAAFQKVLDGFTAKTGIKVQYEQARDFLPALRTRIASGNPPNVAIIPRPGVMTDLAHEGSLKTLADVGLDDATITGAYSQAWKDLGTVDGKLYGIAVKANSKSTIWYKPAEFTSMGLTIPKTWQDLIAVSDKFVAAGKTPWAVGGGDSWTLTDWFENIYVRTAGPDKYAELFGGKLKFTDPTVVNAAKQMTSIVSNDKYVAGGREGVLGTKFTDGIARVFGKNSTAEMYFEGGFVGGIALGDTNKDLKVGTDIAFFPFPTIDAQYDSPLIGAGDLMSAFVDTPQVREFMKYMVSKEAGEIWAKSGAIISPNKLVDASVYPNDLTKAEAAQVASATVFRFDGSDLLPGTLGEDWGTTLQGMVTKPENIEQLLSDFEAKAGQEFNR